MGGINTVGGLNKVGLDYRPEIGQNEPNAVNAHQQEEDDNIIQVNVHPVVGEGRSMVRRLDVLLLNAATKSVSANAETNMKSVGDTLVEKDVITEEEAEKLESLAKDATEKLKALDNYSGREIAKALMSKSGELVWRKGFFGCMNAVAKAVKAAVEAQEALSEELGKFNERLAESKEVDATLQEAFTEMKFQCDRRATEIYSVVVQMYDLTQRDVVLRNYNDPQIAELLDATFKELLPREAVQMHGTAEAFETMKSKFADQMRPLADKLDAFATDANKTLSVAEVAELDVAMTTMKNALANVRKNGIEIRHEGANKEDDVIRLGGDEKEDKKVIAMHTEVDKSLLDEMEKILDDAKEQIDNAKKESLKRARQTFKNELRTIFDLDSLPNGADVMRNMGDNNAVLKQFKDATNKLLGVFDDFASGKLPMEQFDRKFDECKSNFPSVSTIYQTMIKVGFDVKAAKSISKTVFGLNIVAAQFKELMRVGERLKNDASDSMLLTGDVRKIMLGEARLSVYVEAKSRGFEPGDVKTETDQLNIASTKKLGSGIAGTAYLLTTHSGEEYVFKPELDGRLGLNKLSIGAGDAYFDTQTTANLNLATQQTAKVFGCEDLVVSYSVGCHDGQFGIFMEKAKGYTGYQFANKLKDNQDGISPASLKAQIGNTVERTRIKGRVAQKLNKLMWLDIITGQGDRHWENYFVNIDKTTHEVTVKAIDNDASFTANRIGVQKYVIETKRKDDFQKYLKAICQSIHGNSADAEYQKRILSDPGFEFNEDKQTITIDLSKAKSPELGIAIVTFFGSKSVAMPEEIDQEFYDTLMEMDSNPAKKQEYLDAIAPRISQEALRATELRLNDAIAHAKKLAANNKVYGKDDWENETKLNHMTPMKNKLFIKKSDGTTKVVHIGSKSLKVVKDYLENVPPSLYMRDYFDMMFD